MNHTLTIEATLNRAISCLYNSGSESPSLDATVLMCHLLGKPRSYLLTWPEKELTEDEQNKFQAFLIRRVKGEPIAYITGEREFWSLPLMVSSSTLIPRPDTERLVELALDKIPDTPSYILDLGTGTGAIALAIASECPQHTVFGIDLQIEAKKIAEKNANNLSIKNAKFLHGSWFEPIDAYNQKYAKNGMKFALIVSNPPYIAKDDPHLAIGDVRFEPITALVAEEKGLADIQLITKEAVKYLETGGWLLFEHGFEQGKAVRDILRSSGYMNVCTERDYAGNDRVTYAQYLLSQ